MLFSANHQRNNRVSATSKNKTLNNVSSISSSSSPSHPQDSQSQKKSLVTMEDVWKDINLGSIQSQHPQGNHEPRFGSHNHQNQNPNSIFQDFLNRPLNQEPTIPTGLTMSSSSNGDTTTVTALLSSPPLAPPATVLSLNSGAGFEFLDNQDPLVTPKYNLHSHNHLNTSFEALAYTNELELKVAHLKAENARLMRQQDQLRMEAENQQPKKNTLQRASTAPF
ncbi:hypothetical protein YC2023_032866 [Brassica napus]